MHQLEKVCEHVNWMNWLRILLFMVVGNGRDEPSNSATESFSEDLSSRTTDCDPALAVQLAGMT
jgi:hypothetical protein